MNKRQTSLRSRRRQAVGFLAFFGVFAATLLIVAVSWAQTALAGRTEGLYLQQHGVLAHAQLDFSVREQEGCTRTSACSSPHEVHYHFRDLSGTVHEARAQLGDARPGDGSELLKIYYLPEDPTRQMPLESIPNLADVWGPTLAFLLAAAFFIYLCRNVYRSELSPHRH